MTSKLTLPIAVAFTSIVVALHLPPTPAAQSFKDFPLSFLTFGVCFYWINNILNFLFFSKKTITPIDPTALKSQGKPPFALVTGGSSGIGFEISKRLLKKEYNLILVSKSQDELEKAFKELTSMAPKGAIILYFFQDLSLQNSAREVHHKVTALMKEHKGTVEILVNNAGFGHAATFIDSGFGIFRDMINVNILSLTELSHLFGAEMVKRKRGRILHVASITGYSPGPMAAVYSASKSFVRSFSEALAYEFKDSGVGVFTICPGATKTKFAQESSSTKSLIFTIPGLQSKSQDVAELAVGQLLDCSPEIAIPDIVNQLLVYVSSFVPTSITLFITQFLWNPN